MMIVLMFGGQSRSLRALIIVAAIWPQARNAKRLQSKVRVCCAGLLVFGYLCCLWALSPRLQRAVAFPCERPGPVLVDGGSAKTVLFWLFLSSSLGLCSVLARRISSLRSTIDLVMGILCG